MSMTKMTKSAKSDEVKRVWHVVDATDKVLGRLSSKIAHILRGKHKTEYTPHADTGDYVIIINADKIRVTGTKADTKMYYDYSGYPSGLKARTFKKVLAANAEEPVRRAIKRMLPKGPLGNEMYTKLKVYKGAEHPHVAQQPVALEI